MIEYINNMTVFDKGKPIKRWGRKATGLRQGHCYGSRVAGYSRFL